MNGEKGAGAREMPGARDIEKEVNAAKGLTDAQRNILIDMLISPKDLLEMDEAEMKIRALTFASMAWEKARKEADAHEMKKTKKAVEKIKPQDLEAMEKVRDEATANQITMDLQDIKQSLEGANGKGLELAI